MLDDDRPTGRIEATHEVDVDRRRLKLARARPTFTGIPDTEKGAVCWDLMKSDSVGIKPNAKRGLACPYEFDLIGQKSGEGRVRSRMGYTEALGDEGDSAHCIGETLMENRFVVRQPVSRLVEMLQLNGNRRP